jgi:hypothetical protein
MKSSLAILALLSLATTSATSQFRDTEKPQNDVKKGKFGAMEATEWLDDGMRKTVY